MYRVMIERNGEWHEEGNSESFGDAWNYAKVLRKEGFAVKIIGPEGEWPIK